MSDLFKRAKGLLKGTPLESPPPAPARKAAEPWHAVSIVPGERICAAARALKGQRFLSREAPTLPLRECDLTVCKCRYTHHPDRRVGPRRAREVSVTIGTNEKNERRKTQGRAGRRRADP